MRSAVRRTTVIILLAIFLAPGLLQARAPVGTWERATANGPAAQPGFFSMVWNLLTSLWEIRVSGGSPILKEDPSGPSTDPGSGSTNGGTGDNGGGSDPDG
jgi:hypothetical protein